MPNKIEISNCQIIIPAVKKNVAFADDLIKKLDGVMLIQRTIDKAKAMVNNQDIIVVTDSEEISVICERNHIKFHYDRTLKLDESDPLQKLNRFFASFAAEAEFLLVLWPYAPLVEITELAASFKKFIDLKYNAMISVKGTRHQFVMTDNGLQATNGMIAGKEYYVEVKAFSFMQPQTVLSGNAKWQPYELKENRIEIKDYHDWWVCERLLKRKRIVFRVIGHDKVGMGHVYRALSLAHENTNDEILFICDESSTIAVQKIAGHDYPVEVIPAERIVERMIELKPDLVINDILDTELDYMNRLKQAGIKVVNFEDLGKGSEAADITYNALYDEPQIKGKNYRWGCTYNFLRDEFEGARVHSWCPRVKDLLLTFGGTDPSNFTKRVLLTILDFCRGQGIKIHVVTGPGYAYTDEIIDIAGEEGADRILFTNQTGVMSRIMERTPIAISSNGRTIYELAHMHIPSIIIAHHEREATHNFSVETNGFMNLGISTDGIEQKILEALRKLCLDHEYRKMLFGRMKDFNFLPNKKVVLREINELLHGK
jgi:spore coat polysaccharide biosynthesis predicted glycosyltransferase SpsG/CMP-N-acetylneuraminic acid synthetase